MNKEMTEKNYKDPTNRLMIWYEGQEEKTKVLSRIVLTANVSSNTAMKWVKGLAVAKKPEHLAVLEQITGIPATELFNLVN